MARKIFFVTGLSGIGKTTLIQDFIASTPHWKRVSGGDLLLQGTHASRDSLKNVSLEDKLHQQNVIVTRFNGFLDLNQENILFDGHVTMHVSDGNLFITPYEVLKNLHVTAVVVITGQPQTIFLRRKNDSLRLREIEDVETIQHRQNLTLTICRDYASQLNIPMLELWEPTPEQFKASILRL